MVNSPASQNVSTKSKILDTSRGMIYDCNMKKIVNSDMENLTVCLPSADVFNHIAEFVSAEEKKEIYDQMSSGQVCVLSLPKRFEETLIKTVTVSNRYTENQPCVHLIGHLDENGDGAMGIEKAYNNYLKRFNGSLRATWSVDAVGNILWGDGISFQSDGYLSPAGIQLTIDLDVQIIVENVLKSHNIDKGAVVVLNAETSEILALASVPTFNPNNLSNALESENSPFINRALTAYSVGSVFKPLVACAGLENKINFIHDCQGSIDIDGTVFRCNNNKVHGIVNLTTAMEQSCNTYFIALGQKIGNEKLISLCGDFGLGKASELADNFYSKSGNLPASDETSSPQALANLSFGQGKLLASPLQMAIAYSAFANGGYYRPPTLMKGVIDEEGNIIQKVKLPSKYRILNESTVSMIDEILLSVVENGNGNRAYTELTKNHGKTATAQSGWYVDGTEVTHTWFCGYFVVNNTTYTVVIFKESGMSGATDCAPAFKDISEKIYVRKEYK